MSDEAVPRGIDPNARLRLNALEKQVAAQKQPTTYSPKAGSERKDIYYHGTGKSSAPKPRTQGFTGVSIVIGGTVVATGLTVLNQILNGTATIKPVIAGFIVGTFLLIICFFSVEVAAAFSLLLLTTSVLVNAGGILSKVAK